MHTLPTPDRSPTTAIQRSSVADHIDLPAVARRFEEVPIDPYMTDGTRRKSLYRTTRHGDRWTVGPHAGLYQDVETNPTHGGYVRDYVPTDARLIRLLEPVVGHFAAATGLADGEEVLVQAQRITATGGADGRSGQPAVEGWHQDAVDAVGILVVDRVNIWGGVTMLSTGRGSIGAVFGATLAPGELLVFPDRQLWHFTSRIRPLDPTADAYRDVVLLASPGCRPPSIDVAA